VRSGASRATSALVELNCSTGLRAKATYLARALAKLVQIVLENGDTDLGAQQPDGESVDDFVKGLAGTLGENIQPAVRMETTDGLLGGQASQNERTSASCLRRRRPIVGAGPRGAHDVALHIAAPHRAGHATTCRPTSSSTSARFRRVCEEGKPEQVWPKIIDGAVGRVLQGCNPAARPEQAPVKDQKSTVGACGGARRRCRFVASRAKIGEE
jgi:translation elongation factor EF-Ts